MMPPGIAARFTEAERAALSVIATEVKRRGRCDLFVDQIAAYAGVSRSSVKSATRMARRLGLLTIEEWRQAPDWNGPNCIRVVSPEWLTWLAHRREVKMTVKPPTTTRNQYLNPPRFSRGERPQGGYQIRNRGGVVP